MTSTSFQTIWASGSSDFSDTNEKCRLETVSSQDSLLQEWRKAPTAKSGAFGVGLYMRPTKFRPWRRHGYADGCHQHSLFPSFFITLGVALTFFSLHALPPPHRRCIRSRQTMYYISKWLWKKSSCHFSDSQNSKCKYEKLSWATNNSLPYLSSYSFRNFLLAG
jgi:hypothetical protein